MMVFGVPKLFCATTHVVAALIDISAATRATLTIVFIAMPPQKLRRPYGRTSRQMIEISEIFVPAAARLLILRSSREITGTAIPATSNTTARPRHASYCPPSIEVMISMRNGGTPNRARLRGSVNSLGSRDGESNPNAASVSMHPQCVVGARGDPNVQINGPSWIAMQADGIAANEEIVNAVLVE